jgi:cell division protease FtsH
MALVIPENELPAALTPDQAVEAAYAAALTQVAEKLLRGLPVLVECDKELAPHLFVNLRNRLKARNLKCDYLDGVPKKDTKPDAVTGAIGTMIAQLRDAVRGAVEKRVVVLPHLDLLTTSQGNLTSEAREVIPLLYENPDVVVLGFKDPSFSVPKVIESLFPHRETLLGTPRERLRHLVTQREARKFGRGLQPWQLYKYVSGVNAVRLRRLLETLDGEDYPQAPARAYAQLRQGTLLGTLEIPHVDLDTDIGGYGKTKDRLRREILDLLAARDAAGSAADAARLEMLIPRGLILWGPPGTGKTYFAKALASAIGASIQVVSGPELKSKWVGESEDNLRQIFHRARLSAPSVIVFDELDSFATARGTYAGSGVEHSMVNQLLTEMDGFHADELIFVIGTTNMVEAVDPALLRPGRFEFHLHIPYPDASDRRAILKVLDGKYSLKLDAAALEFAVTRTGDYVIGAAAGTRYSGDHLDALARSVARIRLREKATDDTTTKLVEQALTEWVERPKLTNAEEHVLATHEAGHAVVSLFCEHAPPVERVTIQSEMHWAFGYVKYTDPSAKYIQTVAFYRDQICIALGAREAERLLLKDISLGATADLDAATTIARELVEAHGLAGGELGSAVYLDTSRTSSRMPRRADLAPATLALLDQRVAGVIEEERRRAETIVGEQRSAVEALRDLLLEKKTLDRAAIAAAIPVARP